MEKVRKHSSLPIVVNELKSIIIKKSDTTLKMSIKVEKFQSSINYFDGFHRPISKIINLNE